jgi:hypothetical protein
MSRIRVHRLARAVEVALIAPRLDKLSQLFVPVEAIAQEDLRSRVLVLRDSIQQHRRTCARIALPVLILQ